MGVNEAWCRQQAGCVDALGIHRVKTSRIPDVGDSAAIDKDVPGNRLSAQTVADLAAADDYPAKYDTPPTSTMRSTIRHIAAHTNE